VRAIAYGAKSTEDRHGSIPTQLEDCRRMAEREGWQIAGEYADEAASAWSGDRGPELAAAMAHAERIAPCVLCVQHSDRLARGDGRKARHLGRVYFWAIEVGVELRSVQDDSTFTNPLLAVAMGERNAEDSRRKSLAVKAGMERRKRNGLAPGGPRPYGYRYAPGALLAIVEAEAVIVRRIFAEFVAGGSLSAIARGLHFDSVPTVTGAKWRQSTISGILSRPYYVGRVDDETDAQHEAIVDPETWARAQELLAARPSRGRGRPPKGRHLFRGGMLRCECGEAMVPRTRDGYESYSCNGRQKLGLEFCGAPTVRRAEIDSAVYRYFCQVGLDLDATREALRLAADRRLAEVRSLRHEAERERSRAREAMERVERDYLAGALPADAYARLTARASEELGAAEAEAERLSASELEIERDGATLDAESETLRRLTEIRRAIAGEVREAAGVDAVRAALSRLFERFILHRAIPERAHVELIGEPWIEPVLRSAAGEMREALALASNTETASRCARTSPRPSTGSPTRRAPTASR
jgi:site-specific DNA recombinase